MTYCVSRAEARDVQASGGQQRVGSGRYRRQSGSSCYEEFTAAVNIVANLQRELQVSTALYFGVVATRVVDGFLIDWSSVLISILA